MQHEEITAELYEALEFLVGEFRQALAQFKPGFDGS
jgi:hypothetical protein